jgi:hypothetical protein
VTISHIFHIRQHDRPIWFTEIGCWSDGHYACLGQASTVAPGMVGI